MHFFNSSSECSQASLSTSALCHILRIVGTRRLVASTSKPGGPAAAKLTTQTSDHALCAKISSTSRLHAKVGHSPAHLDPRLRRKQSASTSTAPVLASPAGGQQIPASIAKEQTLIAQLIMSIIGARIPDKVHCTYTAILSV